MRKTSFKSLYSLSPLDLVEVKTRASDSTLSSRAAAAAPPLPSTSDDEDWGFYSLEAGALLARSYKLANKTPWPREARARAKRLAPLDPAARSLL